MIKKLLLVVSILSSHAYANTEISLRFDPDVSEVSFASSDKYRNPQGQALNVSGGIGVGILGNDDYAGAYISLIDQYYLIPNLDWVSKVDLGFVSGMVEPNSKSYLVRLNQGLRYKNPWSKHLEDSIGVSLWLNIFEDKELAQQKNIHATNVYPYYSITFCF